MGQEYKPNSKMIRVKLLIVNILLLVIFIANAQDKKITVYSLSKPLSMVLAEISEKYEIRFAYDNDKFQQIKARLDLKRVTLEQFMKVIETEYQIRSKKIEGTWVLVIDHSEQVQVVQNTENREQTKQQKAQATNFVTVSGYIKDQKSGENLMYCNVGFGEMRGTITNELGFFKIELPAAEQVNVFISHLGYRKLDTLISTKSQSVIYLDPFDVMIDAVKVTNEEKNVIEASAQSEKIAFNPQKTSNAPRLANDDMANALLLIPGIDFLQGGNAGISIRGAYPTDNLILFDGIPVLEATHLLGNMSVLNSKFIQQAFVSRGGFDAGFGGKVGGLIELTGKSGKNAQPYLDVSANMLNFNALANLPVSEKFSVTAAWRRSFIDKWQNYLYTRLTDNITTENTQNSLIAGINPTFEYQDINSKISFHPSDNLEFNVNFLYGSDYQSRDYGLLNTKEYYRNELISSENMGFSFNWKWQINENWYQSLSAGFSKLNKSQVDETGKLTEFTEVITDPSQNKGKGKGKGLVKTREKTYTKMVYDTDNGANSIDEYRIEWKTEFNTGIFRNQAGLGWSANSFDYSYLADRGLTSLPIDSIVDDRIQYILSGFIQQNIPLNSVFNFRWGLRSNFDLVSRKIYWQPRGGIEFKPTQNLTFHYSGGVYTQFLSSVKRIDSEGHYNPVWYLPDYEGGGAVNSIHHILGFKFERDGWLVNAEAFTRETNGKMNLLAKIIRSGTKSIVRYSPDESDEFGKGIDLMIEKRQGNLNHILGYSISKSEEKMHGLLNGTRFPSANDRLHRLRFTEMATWKNWTISGIFNFGTGLPVYNLTNESSINNYTRTDDFLQLDFSLSKRIVTKHFSANAGVSLLNVLNRKNLVEVDYLRFTSETGSLSVRSDVSSMSFSCSTFLLFQLFYYLMFYIQDSLTYKLFRANFQGSRCQTNH